MDGWVRARIKSCCLSSRLSIRSNPSLRSLRSSFTSSRRWLTLCQSSARPSTAKAYGVSAESKEVSKGGMVQVMLALYRQGRVWGPGVNGGGSRWPSSGGQVSGAGAGLVVKACGADVGHWGAAGHPPQGGGLSRLGGVEGPDGGLCGPRCGQKGRVWPWPPFTASSGGSHVW